MAGVEQEFKRALHTVESDDRKIKDSDKIYLKDILNKLKEEFTKNKFDMNKSPLKILFNDNPKIKSLIA